jgi:hypothetical protein
MADVAHIDPELQELVHRFFPRAAAGDAKLVLKTTSELHAVLDEHMPGRWKAHEVATLLDQDGYERRLVGDELRWLVLPKG